MSTDLQQIKSRVVTLARRAAVTGRDLAEDFRRQTPYFKARVGVLAGFLAVVTLTQVVAAPGAPDNPCGTEATLMQLSFKTVVRVKNVDGDDYGAVVVGVRGDYVSLDSGERRQGEWRSAPQPLAEGQELVLDHKQLLDASGRSPETIFNARELTVRCDDRVSTTLVK